MSDRVKPIGFPPKQGLYDPANEKDSCGVGFVANVKGVPSHQNVLDALEMLGNMEHRGGCGCEPNTGDGAGILVGLPETFLRNAAKEDLGVELPAKGRFGAGLVFLPKIESERQKCFAAVEAIIGKSVFAIFSSKGQSVSEQLAILIISYLCSTILSTDSSSKGVHMAIKPCFFTSASISKKSSSLIRVSEKRFTYLISCLFL